MQEQVWIFTSVLSDMTFLDGFLVLEEEVGTFWPQSHAKFLRIVAPYEKDPKLAD